MSRRPRAMWAVLAERRDVCALAVVMSVALWAAHLGATVVLPADFPEMVAGSQVVVHGRVTDVRAQALDGRRTIESVVTVSVEDALKGRPGASVVFRVPGGTIGRYRRVTVGAPQFNEGDEVIVFLRGEAPALPVVFGMNQGLYRIARDAAGLALVTPPPVLAAGAGAERIVRGDPARQAMPIEAFALQVRAAISAAMAEPAR